jgi:type VI protein secretion system component VasK
MTAEVIYQLKKSGLSNYSLPWFMVLGPRGSGKSVLLNNSGLVFSWEYVSSESCKWLFSDKAIFIHVNFEINHDEWIALLTFLKKYRPKIPLNGILLVLKPAARDSSVKTIREYLAEIIDITGYLLPITTIFTYLDTVMGFDVFFKHSPDILVEHQEKLAEKLLSCSLKISQSQSSIDAKLKSLNFPENFRVYKTRLDLFLTELTRENPYQDTPNFREVYFTGFKDKPYFIQPLFTQLFQAVSNNTIISRKKLGILRWMTSVSIATASIVILSVFFIASASFAHTAIEIHQGIRLGQTVENSSNTEDFTNLANYLADHPPENLKIILENILLKNLEHQIIPNLFNSLETQLALLQERWALATPDEEEAMRGDYYNQLKIYLMFCHPNTRYPEFYQGNSLMAFYLNHSHKNWPERSDLVQLSRQQLSVPADLKNIYAGFKSWGEKVGSISASDLVGSSLEGNDKIPVFFTARGFNLYALLEIERLSKTSSGALKDPLLTLYKSDYKKAWLNFLQTLRPASGSKISEKTVRKILALAHQNILFEDISLADYKPENINTIVQVVNDSMTREAVRNVLLLPVRADYMIHLSKIKQDLDSSWKTQVYSVYTQRLVQKYPFLRSNLSSQEEASSEDINQLFDPSQGVFWQFVHQKLNPYFSSNYLGMTVGFSPEFLHSLSLAKIISTRFNFEVYPEPTLGLKEIRLVSNHQSYRYRNDPQEWQSLHWELDQNDVDTVLEIITSSGSVGSIEIESPWGLFKLLQKAALLRNKDGSFHARWKIRADNGHVYVVNLLFRGRGEAMPHPNNNLFEVLLFNNFRLPSSIFVQ